MTSLRFRKRRAPNVVRGGRAIPLDNNGELYYLQGRSHAQGGIDIGKNPKTGIEAEGGEIVQMKPNELRVLSAQDFIGGGVSPAKQVLAGADPDKVFNEQERFKDIHRLNDDGSKYEKGGDKKGPWTGQDNEKRRERLYRTVNPGSNFFSLTDWINNGILYLVNDKNSNRLKHEEFSSNPEEEEMFKSYLSDKPIYEVLPKTDVRLAKDVNPDGTYNTNKQYVGLSKRQKDSIRDNLIENYLGSPADFISSQKGKNGWKVIDDRRYGDGYLSMLGKFSIRENNNSGIYEIMDTYDFPSWIPIPDRNKGHELVIRDTIWTKDAKPELYIDEAKIKSNFLRNVINKNKLDKEYEIKRNGGMIATINGNVKNGLITTPRFKSGGSIHIDPSKRGTFTAAAKAHGKSVQGFASQVLANKDNYSSAMVKKANFARNASKWNHKAYGGRIKADDGNKTKSNKDNTKSTRGLRNPELTESWANTIGGASSIQRQIANPTDWMDINEQQDRWSALYANSGYIPGDEFSRRTPGTSAYQKDFNARYNDANQNMDLAIGRRGNSGDSFNSYTDNDEQGYFGPMTYRRNLGVARNAQERIDITNYYNQLNPDLGVFFREDGSVRVMPKLSTPELKVPEAVRPDLGPISNTIVPQAHARAVQQDALHRAPFAKNYRDEIGLGLGLAGSLLDPILRGRKLRDLRSWNPYLEAPVKLKTNWNINPQLDRIRESSQEAYRDIDANTASSSNALARKQRVRNQAQYAANEQWATKENKETELINQDKINRQGVRNRNANRLNQWAADDARIRNRIILAKADNISNAIQNVVGVGLDYLGRKDFKDYVNNTKAAIAAGAPNVDDRYMIAQGLGLENPYNTGIPTYANTPYRRSRFGSRTRLNRR